MPNWRRAGGAPVCQAKIRLAPEDFQVTEIIDIELDGLGEHDWLWVRKTNTNSEWLARQLARFAGIETRDVGFAGHKDRHAVTHQWYSVRRKTGAGYDWDVLHLPGVEVLKVARHSRKLRRGAHCGNRFDLLLRELQGDPQDALQRISGDGVPNYFGEQRFGRAGANISLARSLFGGRRLRRDKRSLALSAARSLIFNDVLAARVSDGTWNQLLPGDYAVLEGSRSHFKVESVDAALTRRCEDFDLHPSGPLWGKGAGMPDSLLIERTVARTHAELATGLEKFTEVARRALRLKVVGLEWALERDNLRMGFDLPSGAFATAVLREIADYKDGFRDAKRASLQSGT
ncbi:MAG: tRNA pseudouridine(13) synthase TruD [Woeseia sp.]|nr:tRNA pseudouridine(13) synthase TruD [Woeseia sp.]